MINSQSQKGGDGSTNLQAQQMVVHVGIDEKRARLGRDFDSDIGDVRPFGY